MPVQNIFVDYYGAKEWRIRAVTHDKNKYFEDLTLSVSPVFVFNGSKVTVNATLTGDNQKSFTWLHGGLQTDVRVGQAAFAKFDLDPKLYTLEKVVVDFFGGRTEELEMHLGGINPDQCPDGLAAMLTSWPNVQRTWVVSP